MSTYINVPKIILDSITDINSDCIKVYLLLCNTHNNTINIEEIASKLNLTNDMVSTYITELEQKGLIETQSGRFKIINEPIEFDNDIKEFLQNIEILWKKPLTPAEAEKIIYLVHDLHISKDMIVYVINVCAGKGILNMNYCEKVVLNLHEQGINTVDQAKQKFSPNASFQQRDYDFKNLEAQIIANE